MLNSYLANLRLTNFLKLMKVVFILLWMGTLSLWATDVHSQNAIIHIRDYQNLTIERFIREVESQTNYLFVYSKSEIDTGEQVTLPAREVSVKSALDKISVNAKLSYLYDNDYIVLTKRELSPESAFTVVMQGITITGTVTDATGEPMPGLNVIIKGTTTGVITNSDGSYSVSVADRDAILVFSFIGYAKQEIAVGDRTNINVVMEEDSKEIEEVVVVGYGTRKKEHLTGSIATVRSKTFDSRSSASPATMLQGTAAGLTVLQTANYPGAGASIKIREKSSFASSSTTEPLYVIDGIQKTARDFALLNPADIDNISILKDAASAAIYGMKAGNGVVLITTKTGSAGKPNINFSSAFSTRRPTMFPEYMNAFELASAVNKTYELKGLTPSDPAWFADDELEYFKTHTYQNDWKDAVWMNNPSDQVYNLSVSGGAEKYGYYISGSYLKQKGATNNNYEKYTFLAKVTGKVAEGLDFSLNINASFDNSQRPYWAYGNTDDLRGLIARAMGSAAPFRPVFINDMPVGNTDNTNMGALARGEGGYVKKDGNTFSPIFELKYKLPWVDGLAVKVRGNYSLVNSYNKTLGLAPWVYFFKTAGTHNHIITDELDYRTLDAAQTGGTGSTQRLTTRYDRSHFYQMNYLVEYNNTFGLHDISAVAGYEQLRNAGDWMNTTVDGFPNLNYTEVDGSLGKSDEKKRWVGGDQKDLWSQASYIARVDYSYGGRYLLGLTFRADGSYKFAPGERWGYFPGISAGWNIARESFFSSLNPYIGTMKLRASWGITGTDNVDPWLWQQSYGYASSSGFLFNGEVVPKTTLAGTINPGITWEKNRNIGFGLDAAMPNNLFFISLDYWNKRTTDILGPRVASIPEEVGASLPAVNYGIASAHGFELTAGHENRIGDLTYRISGNISFFKNKIVEMDQAAAVRSFENRIGTPTDGGMWGYVCEGIIRTQADVDRIMQEHGPDFTIFGVAPKPGMLMYSDLRGPVGVDNPDGKIDGNDQKYISWNGIPRISYGFNISAEWKYFDLSANFAGFARYEGYARGNWFLPNGWYNNQTYWNDQWTPENTNAKLPSGGWQGDVMGVNNVNQASTFWLQNRSFMRLKSLVIGCNIPTAKLAPIKSVRIYLSGENLFEITAGDWMRYSDPELGDGGNYPILRSFTAGVSINF